MQKHSNAVSWRDDRVKGRHRPGAVPGRKVGEIPKRWRITTHRVVDRIDSVERHHDKERHWLRPSLSRYLWKLLLDKLLRLRAPPPRPELRLQVGRRELSICASRGSSSRFSTTCDGAWCLELRCYSREQAGGDGGDEKSAMLHRFRLCSPGCARRVPMEERADKPLLVCRRHCWQRRPGSTNRYSERIPRLSKPTDPSRRQQVQSLSRSLERASRKSTEAEKGKKKKVLSLPPGPPGRARY